MNRLLISAAHKSSGKTTLSIGLCAAFNAQGHTVQPFKKGPDYIDPMWLGRATHRPCINLDFYTMQRDEILANLEKYSSGSDLALIEGNKGLYDGLDIEGSNSNAALARLSQTPVVLVIDVQGMTRGIAPLLLGYQAFEPELNIAGVILNQIRGARHESKLHAVIEHYTDIPVVGAVFHNPKLAITERHLGLIPSNEQDEAEQQIEKIGNIIKEQVELEKLFDIAASAAPLPPQSFQWPACNDKQKVKIAIARDNAFGFYYPDDLEYLKCACAELVEFDALHDARLPDCDGLFIGGGFPETQMAKLEANVKMRNAIHSAIENGLPTYAECGGLMYLSRSISWQGQKHAMVGIIPGDISMHERPVGRGYVQLAETENHPWPASVTPSDAVFPGHEFHYSSLDNLQPGARFAYDVKRGMGITGKNDGFLYKNLLASYAHLRDTSHQHWTERFVQFVRSRTAKNPL